MPLFHHIEVMVERRDLIGLRHRYAHFGSKRRKMIAADAAELVLDKMQILDEQIAPPRRLSQ